MYAFFKLVRYKNLLIVALTQYLLRWGIVEPILQKNGFSLQLSELNFFILVLSTVLITAAGYIINDYFDRKTDLINRKETVIVGNKINRRTVMTLHLIFNFAGIALGGYLSYIIGNFNFIGIYILVTTLLWFYSTNFKRMFFIGNLIVAFLTALVPFMVILFEIPLLNHEYKNLLLSSHNNFNSITFWIIGYAFFAFMLTLIREIIKDIEDFEGDYEYGSNTLPIYLGVTYTKVIVFIFIIFTCISLFYVYFNYVNDGLTFWFFSIFLVLPLSFLAIKLITAKTKKNYSFLSTLSKIIMLAGIFYIGLAYYIIDSL